MFTYRIINEEKSTIIFPEGEFKTDAFRELKDIVSCGMGPGMFLQFNMAGVSFLDSAGVGFLVQMKNLADKSNGTFEIRQLQKNPRMVLDRLTLNEFLNVSSDTAFSDI